MIGTIKIMNAWEAVRHFIDTKKARKEWSDLEQYKSMDISDDASIMEFLDAAAEHGSGVERLTNEQCDLFGLEWAAGYYTWKNSGELRE